MTTREDREAAANLIYIDRSILRRNPATVAFVEGPGRGLSSDSYGLARTAAAFAVHREAAVAAERERIAKILDAESVLAKRDWAHAEATTLARVAAKIRGGK